MLIGKTQLRFGRIKMFAHRHRVVQRNARLRKRALRRIVKRQANLFARAQQRTNHRRAVNRAFGRSQCHAHSVAC